ncbi:hypothetical protein ACT54J_18700, partial [Leptospira interrogans]
LNMVLCNKIAEGIDTRNIVESVLLSFKRDLSSANRRETLSLRERSMAFKLDYIELAVLSLPLWYSIYKDQ